MNITNLISEKITQYVNHCLTALDFFYKDDYEHAATDFRKSAEAFLKILVLNQFGDTSGLQIINGEIDVNLTPKQSPYKSLMLNDLLQIRLNNIGHCFARLKDIQKSNPTAHNGNTNTGNNDYKRITELCKSQSLELTQFLFTNCNMDVPNDLSEAYNGNINQAIIVSVNSSEWEDFHNYVDEFSPHCKYILISPKKYGNCTEKQLNILSRLPWSFIVDFDINSKENGLHKAFMPNFESRINPITINQLGQRNVVSNGVSSNINWLFASGINGDPISISTTYRNWRTKKYPNLLTQLFTEFTATALDRICIVVLDDDYNYVDEIIRIVCDIDHLSLDLVKIAVVSSNQNFLDKTLDLNEKYDVECNRFNISITEVISKAASIYKSKNSITSAKLIPARVENTEVSSIDIANIYSVLTDDGITPIYHDIENAVEVKDDKPTYFFGEIISWYNLSQEIEAKRNKYNDFKTKITGLLNSSKASIKIELQHFPGAGGTTMSRRLAFDLRRDYPIALITKYKSTATLNSLLTLVYKVKKPIAVFVEASAVNANELDELIRGCNFQKQVVIFVYVIRAYQKIKETDKLVSLSDKMLDISEQQSFIAKVRQFTKNDNVVEELSKLQPGNSEVINYALAISDGYYSKDRIDNYLHGYINQLPEPQVKFTAFTALIYYYSQKSTSENLFRSLFTKSLTEDLRQISIDKRHIHKILIQELSDSGYTEYWRPRFHVFAESILRTLLKKGKNWRDNVLSYALELINVVKENNPYLVDETRDILKGVFLERRNEDLLGRDEEWASVTNDQFSSILNDITDFAGKKSVLIHLASSYPEEAHFWGHLARFVYENASTIEEFDEAMSYINKAFEADGDNDYNLHHIAGMCKRRQIEYHKRNDDEISNAELIQLANDANYHFSTSMSLNHKNVHAYISQIQLITTVLEYGKSLSRTNDFTHFITIPENAWYLEQYNSLCILIDESKMLIEQLETLGKTKRTDKAKKYLLHSEGNSNNVIGNFYHAIDLFKRLIDTSERDARPRLRFMYIRSVLLSKVRGDNSKIREAWGLLKDSEIDSIDKFITDNILHDASDIYTLRLWFQFIRYSSKKISLEEIKSKLKILHKGCDEHSLMRLESSYYLYIVNALLLLKANTGLNYPLIQETKELISEAQSISYNDKFAFEWLMSLDGIGGLVNHKDKRHIPDDNLVLINGTISKIISRQQGILSMPCGLNAFFTPAYGEYIASKDETTEVKFNLAFRHDGLVAYNVTRITDETSREVVISTQDEIDEIIETEQISDPIIELQEKEKSDNKDIGLKIVGKIDLSKFDKYKKK